MAQEWNPESGRGKLFQECVCFRNGPEIALKSVVAYSGRDVPRRHDIVEAWFGIDINFINQIAAW